MLSRPVLVAALLSACGHPKGGDHPDRCTSLAPNVFVSGEGRPGDPREKTVVAAIASACRADNWTPEVMSCFARPDDAKTDAKHGYDDCSGLMSERARANLERAFEAGKSSGASDGDDMPPPPEPESSGYSCFSWDNKMSQSRETICSADCATRRASIEKTGKLVANLTACEGAATVWCFTANDEEVCQPTQDGCQQKHDSVRYESASPTDCSQK